MTAWRVIWPVLLVAIAIGWLLDIVVWYAFRWHGVAVGFLNGALGGLMLWPWLFKRMNRAFGRKGV